MHHVHRGDTVTIHYAGSLGDGTLVLASPEEDPYRFRVGSHETIPALEKTVLDMEPGETRTVSVCADEAFGPYRPELVQGVHRGQFPPDLDIEGGQRLPFTLSSGLQILVTVVAVLGTEVIVDANHPLAGLDLTFEIRLLEVRPGHPEGMPPEPPFAAAPWELPDLPS